MKLATPQPSRQNACTFSASYPPSMYAACGAQRAAQRHRSPAASHRSLRGPQPTVAATSSRLVQLTASESFTYCRPPRSRRRRPRPLRRTKCVLALLGSSPVESTATSSTATPDSWHHASTCPTIPSSSSGEATRSANFFSVLGCGTRPSSSPSAARSPSDTASTSTTPRYVCLRYARRTRQLISWACVYACLLFGQE